jgi:hypothetical protein
MRPTTGYYSIIQYCPDAARHEVANVGVVLLCPELRFLKARMAEDIQRIKEVFPRLKPDRKRLHSTVFGFTHRFHVDREYFQTVEDLRKFAETRANAMRLTLPLPTRVEDPEAELNRLFARLVGESEKQQKGAGIVAALTTAFEKEEVAHLVRRKVTLKLPRLNRPIEAPFGFQNARFNVIEPAKFARQSTTGILSLVGRFEIEGDLLFEAPHPKLGPLQLLVVAQFGKDEEDVVGFVQGRLGQGHARLVRIEHVNRLIEEIRSTAKPIDASLLG